MADGDDDDDGDCGDNSGLLGSFAFSKRSDSGSVWLTVTSTVRILVSFVDP